MDLAGTSWTVLSACDTGLGTVRSGEGVLGLARAFQRAGVGTVIMSLWPVDDAAARDWMHTLYDARFARGQSTAVAMRAAARAVKAQGGDHRHPFFWAPFVAAGDWR
jgi:CHAT domain-containing protein